MQAPAAPASSAPRASIITKASGTVISLLFGTALAAIAVRAGWGRDFAAFYHSAAALADGVDPYRTLSPDAAVNINLPHATALLVPLSALPLPVAFAIWQLVQLTAWALLLRRLVQATPSLPRMEFAAAAVLFPGTLAQLAQGQWGFLLAWAVACGWTANRARREVEAGAWLGVAMAAKPFVGLLVAVLCVQRRFKAVAAAVGAASVWVVAGMVWLGVAPYISWFRAAGSVDWAGYASNASVRGMLERTFPNPESWLWVVSSLAIAVVTLVTSARCRNDSVTWTLALAAALLASPLGWLYYGWMLAPSLLALDSWPIMFRLGLVLLWIPPGLAPAFSTATVGLFLLWISMLRLASSRELAGEAA